MENDIMEIDWYTEMKNNTYKIVECLTTKEDLVCIRLKNWGK